MKTIGKIGVGLLFACGMSVAAIAQEGKPPRFDVESHCKKVASFGGEYSASLFRGCMDMEQDAYNKLKGAWGGLPATMRRHCEKVARFGGGGSYSILSGCVDMELDASNQNANEKFEY
ncbi:hypothetical protein [Aestuariivirga sp.]|uniref:hypothetical protein n=1 Tax=Aestuariivirga sp. TaxID=2650926 RepID=UPI00391ADB36